MKIKEKIVNVINSALLMILLCVFVWQLYSSFIKYEYEFENPLLVTKQEYGNDFITQYGDRFKEIKKMFLKPTNLTYIGEESEDFSTGALHYVLTQYYLAPNLLLRNDVVRDTIIYNLYNSKQINTTSNFHLNSGWHIVKDFRNGIIILAK